MILEMWQAYLFFAFAAFLVLPTSRGRSATKFSALVLAACLGFVPIDGLPLAAYPRSLLDDPALTTVLWMAYAVALRFQPGLRITLHHRFEVVVCFAVLTLLLYPAALGLTYIDPYRLGFDVRVLLALILMVTFGFWLRRNYFGVLLLAGATLGFVVDLKNSDNYWDYLIDPLIGLYCWFVLMSAFASRACSGMVAVASGIKARTSGPRGSS